MFSKCYKDSFLNITLVLIFCITASYSIVYSNIQNFPGPHHIGNSDSAVYLSMYKNEPLARCEKCRILTPLLAKLIPDPPSSFFSESRITLDDTWIPRIKFGVVNFCFLVGGGDSIVLFSKKL